MALAAGGCLSNCSTRPGLLEAYEELWAPWLLLTDYFEYQPWLFSLIGSAMVGLSGVFPLLVIPIDEAADLKHGESAKTLKILLSFAVGGLLGDVFLHLLPEAWANHAAANIGKSSSHATMGCGLWVLCGFLVFVIAEKLFGDFSNSEDEKVKESPAKYSPSPKINTQKHENNNSSVCGKMVTEVVPNRYVNGVTKLNGLRKDQRQNGLNKDLPKNSLLEIPSGVMKNVNGVTYCNGIKKDCNGYKNGFSKTNGVIPLSNGFCDFQKLDTQEKELGKKVDDVMTRDRPKHISGYLNLMANCVDNFTHGLAVGGSFLVSFRLGALTTFAILIHEIPHEIGDFAILLKSGFNRWDAAKAQIMTASGGIFGAFAAVVFSGDAVESKTSWILPFTAGGFLHIGLVTVLPELLKETSPWESLKQMGALLTGIVIMAFLTIMCD